MTLVDAYGPGNARSTSGDESRGAAEPIDDRGAGGQHAVNLGRPGVVSRQRCCESQFEPDAPAREQLDVERFLDSEHRHVGRAHRIEKGLDEDRAQLLDARGG